MSVEVDAWLWTDLNPQAACHRAGVVNHYHSVVFLQHLEGVFLALLAQWRLEISYPFFSVLLQRCGVSIRVSARQPQPPSLTGILSPRNGFLFGLVAFEELEPPPSFVWPYVGSYLLLVSEAATLVA